MRKWRSKSTASLVTLLLIGSLILAGSGGLAPDASAAGSATLAREGPGTSPSCGGSVTLALLIDWTGLDGGPTALTIEENFPTDWTLDGITGGGSSGVAGRLTWFITDPGIEKVEYTLAVPQDAQGSFPLSGVYRDSSMGPSDPNKQIDGLQTLQVACDEAEGGDGQDEEDPAEGEDPTEQGTRIVREMSSTAECDTSVTVTLQLDWGPVRDGRMFFIEEAVPEGWTVSSATNGGSLDTTGVKWWLTDPSVQTISYQATPPAETTGPALFTGEYRDDLLAPDQPSRTIDGLDEIQISCDPEGPGPVLALVEREDLINPECGDQIEVRLLIHWNDSTALSIQEDHPDGWSLVAADDQADTSVPGTVAWNLQGGSPTLVHYTLEVPADAEGTFAFDGALQDLSIDGEPIGLQVEGDDTVTVFCDPAGSGDGDANQDEDDETDPESGDPQAEPDEGEGPQPADGHVTRTIETVCTGTFTVTLQVDPSEGTSSWFLDETLPPGLELVSAGEGSFNEDAGAIRWVKIDGAPSNISYELSVPEGTPDGTGFDWSGEFRFHPVMDLRAGVLGDQSLQTDCQTAHHPFDQDQNCVIGDNEVFALVDAWKIDETDDEALFAGIDAWKLQPESYC